MISIPGIQVGPHGAAVPAGQAAQSGQSPPTQVDVFVDYMCPYCRRFEQDNAAALQQLVDRDVTALVMHPIAILDRLSAGSLYSTRAAAAAYAVAAGAPARFGAFNAALFADQPREGSAGLSEAELRQVAAASGIEQAVGLTLAGDQFTAAAQAGTQAALEAGLQGTPTVLLSSRHHGAHLWDGSRPVAEWLLSLAAR
ncbi:MAG: thioredoxin domain-containing protein [Bifidobacteriaceae bacterium]|jgi:protein-disulfide isomerase|nr:thioredoxin domain-containing protein [Bifidobacteriaceae bacterium]